ncbi:hypothetical protein [Micromonospora sp. NBC_01412]|uniref:hypothetical protein n=1 Tax=Micromonospora sp. NBC_01412 TaxID=2903590 RepID=UPI0032457D6E
MVQQPDEVIVGAVTVLGTGAVAAPSPFRATLRAEFDRHVRLQLVLSAKCPAPRPWRPRPPPPPRPTRDRRADLPDGVTFAITTSAAPCAPQTYLIGPPATLLAILAATMLA